MALNVIEAARISAVVEEALEKLSFLASITPDVMAHRDELSQIVGDEITRIIQEQRGLETRYEMLISQRTSLKALSNKNKFNENQEQVKEVARALRESTKELCRNLKVGDTHGGLLRAAFTRCWHPSACSLSLSLTALVLRASQGNPNIAENLSKIQTERSNLQNLLSKTLRELRESSFATLTTTVEEEKARNDMIREVVQKEKEVSAAVKKLQADLASEKQLHLQEVEERNEIIAKLKEDLVCAARLPRTRARVQCSWRRADEWLHPLTCSLSLSLCPVACRLRCVQSRRSRPSICTRWRARAASRSTARTGRRRRSSISRFGT